VRYVGYTVNSLEQRLGAHLRRAKYEHESHKSRWLRSLGYVPQIVEIEVVNEERCDEAERRWIAYYRALGFDLVNKTDGGKGTLGWKQPPELVERRSALLRGRPCAEETKQAISVANTGKRRTDAAKALMRVRKLGMTWSEERRAAHVAKYGLPVPIANPTSCSTCGKGPFKGQRGLHRHVDNSPGCVRPTEGYEKKPK